MAINKDLEGKFLSFIGVDELETEEQFEKFKETFNSKFIPRDKAHEYEDISGRVIAKRMGEVTSALNDFGKSIGMDVSFEKLREKKAEEIIGEYKGFISNRLTELETRAKDGNDKKVNDLTKELEEARKSLHSYKEANEQLMNEYEGFKTEQANAIKNFKINHQLDKIKGSISWVDGINDIQRAGFDTVLSQNYKFDLDETDSLTVMDKDGKLIPLKDKAGAFADPATVISQVAEMGGLLKKNNLDGKKKTVTFDRKSDSGTDDQVGKRVSPAYLQRRKELGI